jgi:hypothetical protein
MEDHILFDDVIEPLTDCAALESARVELAQEFPLDIVPRSASLFAKDTLHSVGVGTNVVVAFVVANFVYAFAAGFDRASVSLFIQEQVVELLVVTREAAFGCFASV